MFTSPPSPKTLRSTTVVFTDLGSLTGPPTPTSWVRAMEPTIDSLELIFEGRNSYSIHDRHPIEETQYLDPNDKKNQILK
mmetsp:Transcript_9611/g.19643  ORF Transcript_9611/g.19643 Transcript_9611/m.19643 type:complete len:80 (-) Transcript_9611:177-416(-)